MKRGSKKTGGKAQKPPPAPVRPALQYKVIELSTVDEASIERQLNEWVPRGWNFEGLQFAMRESSKRPAMAFLFLTRPGAALEHDELQARDRLRRLTQDPAVPPAAATRPVSAYERLAQLAGEGDEPEAKDNVLHLDRDE